MASENVLTFPRVILMRLSQMKQNGNQKVLLVAMFDDDLSTYINFKSQGLIDL